MKINPFLLGNYTMTKAANQFAGSSELNDLFWFYRFIYRKGRVKIALMFVSDQRMSS